MNARNSWLAVLGGVVVTRAAFAHGPATVALPWWRHWTWDPAMVATLFFFGAIYLSGLSGLRRATGSADKLRREAWCYGAGWFLLVVALLSPIHPWGQVFFSVHMVQHEVLMVAAAPLLVLGRPLLVMLHALPGSSASRFVRVLRHYGGTKIWHALTNPFLAWLLHALALWLWHVPALFELTLTHDGMHALQHACFLGSALVFWHAVIFGPRRRLGFGMGVLYLFTTAIHSGALGALLTFATQVWYPAYATGPGIAGLTALEDQQLGGLIMWLPAGVIYLVAGLALFALWIRSPNERRSDPPGESTALPCATWF